MCHACVINNVKQRMLSRHARQGNKGLDTLVGASKHRGGSGGPARVFAMV